MPTAKIKNKPSEEVKTLAPQRIVDSYRALKVGGKFRVWSKNQSQPHAMAAHIGIRVVTELVKDVEPIDGKMLIEVTRIK